MVSDELFERVLDEKGSACIVCGRTPEEWLDVDDSDDGAEDLIREATLRLLDDVLDEDGALECPHDDCDRTFPTRRKLRGHLGSSEHALDVPEGDFWCGYCGYGPTSWRGINAHHGSSDHDGDPVRLDEEPDREDLIAPDSGSDRVGTFVRFVERNLVVLQDEVVAERKRFLDRFLDHGVGAGERMAAVGGVLKHPRECLLDRLHDVEPRITC